MLTYEEKHPARAQNLAGTSLALSLARGLVLVNRAETREAKCPLMLKFRRPQAS